MKKLLAFLLCLTLCLGLFPAAVFAAEEASEEPEVAEAAEEVIPEEEAVEEAAEEAAPTEAVEESVEDGASGEMSGNDAGTATENKIEFADGQNSITVDGTKVTVKYNFSALQKGSVQLCYTGSGIENGMIGSLFDVQAGQSRNSCESVVYLPKDTANKEFEFSLILCAQVEGEMGPGTTAATSVVKITKTLGGYTASPGSRIDLTQNTWEPISDLPATLTVPAGATNYYKYTASSAGNLRVSYANADGEFRQEIDIYDGDGDHVGGMSDTIKAGDSGSCGTDVEAESTVYIRILSQSTNSSDYTISFDKQGDRGSSSDEPGGGGENRPKATENKISILKDTNSEPMVSANGTMLNIHLVYSSLEDGVTNLVYGTDPTLSDCTTFAIRGLGAGEVQNDWEENIPLLSQYANQKIYFRVDLCKWGEQAGTVGERLASSDIVSVTLGEASEVAFLKDTSDKPLVTVDGSKLTVKFSYTAAQDGTIWLSFNATDEGGMTPLVENVKANETNNSREATVDLPSSLVGKTVYIALRFCADSGSRDPGTLLAVSERTSVVMEAHVHELEKVSAKSATCGDDGNIEYYYCAACNGVFTDSAGKNEIQRKDVVVPATGDHTLEEVAAKEATKTTVGNHAYYCCSVCKQAFKDARGTQPTTAKEESIARKMEIVPNVKGSGAAVDETTMNRALSGAADVIGLADATADSVKDALKGFIAPEKSAEMSEAIAEALKNNKEVSVAMNVEKVGSIKPEQEEKLAQKIPETSGVESVVAAYLDLSVELKTEDSSLGDLTELPEAVKFTVEVDPAKIPDLENAPAGKARKIFVARIHGDTVELIPATLSGTTLSFETSQFSEFAIVTVTYVPGDVDGDGEVRAEDLVRMANYLSGNTAEVNGAATDNNNDNATNLLDLVSLMKTIASK